MERNRYFKATIGVGAEVVIAASMDTSGAESEGIFTTSATSTLTVAASPAAGDRITFTLLGVPYTYTVLSTDTTAAILVPSIVAYLNTFNQAWIASATGTTSASFTFAARTAGTTLNGGSNAIAVGVPNVSTFSAAVATGQFGTNGTNPVPAGAAANYQTFVASSPAGSLGLYWDDNFGTVSGGNSNLSVAPGALSAPANAQRSYFYAWKDSAGNPFRTSPIPAAFRKVTTSRYAAAAADIWTVNLAGTLTAGQTIWIRIIDKTSAQIPFPNWEYSVVSSGSAATDGAALVALINAEINEKPVASASGTSTVTITGLANNRTLFVSAWLDVAGIFNSGSAISTDQSAFVITQTQFRTVENGTYADMLELEKYLKIRNGIMVYTNEGTIPDEFGKLNSNLLTSGQYGYIVVKAYNKGSDKVSQTTVNPVDASVGYYFIVVPDTLVVGLSQY